MNEGQEEWAYRAIDPQFRNSSTGEILAPALELRPNEDELSVYSARKCRPRDVLQRLIDHLNDQAQSRTGRDRIKFQEWVERKGSTVERRVELGWRVARLPLSAFVDRGFEAGDVESDGHIVIRGSRQDFVRYSKELVGLAEVVSVE